jgi:hypothetical protein
LPEHATETYTRKEVEPLDFSEIQDLARAFLNRKKDPDKAGAL